jgi:gliding motility-associated-like protein
MILILLAALFGAAQEAIVVNEGAITNHFVEKHSGSNYAWGIYIDFSPDVEAPPDKYEIIGSSDEDKVQIKWRNAGIYYLKVTETDLNGCENLKVLPVNVISNTRSIGFLTTSGSACFNQGGNGFSVPLVVLGNNGKPLNEDYFPLVVEFLLNEKGYSQEISFNNQMLTIQDDWLNVDKQSNFNAMVEIISAKDVQINDIPPDSNLKTYNRTIQALPQIEFETLLQTVKQGTQVTYKVKMLTGKPENSVYTWSLSPENGTTTNLSAIKGSSATILWSGMPGFYTLQVGVSDGNGCIGESISRQIQIVESDDFIVDAGNDTIISGSKPFQLHTKIVGEPGETYTYEWFPKENLDNPYIPNPIYTPGTTTEFIVVVTNSKGISISDTIKLMIVYVIADAGNDVYMEQNSSVILDGTGSVGTGLQFKWTTITGKIDSGENTATPIVSGFGAYYLEITDESGVIDTDSVNVYRLTHAPVANDDYDTTRYLTEVKIPVLNNDTDKDNSIVPSTLTISMSPLNGTAYVDFDDYTVHYRPNESFSGTDNFEYQICNTYNECDRANVYVLVTDFKFLIPNAFSPNGDGINDYFEIIGIDYYEGNSLTIINRWGNKVYETKGYGITTTPKYWDGKANTGVRIGDEELPTGTYYYILELGNGEKSIGGSIYLDR